MSTNAIQHQSKSFPLGATLSRGGANFSVLAKHSRGAQLQRGSAAVVRSRGRSRAVAGDRSRPANLIVLTTIGTFVPDVIVGQLYGYRVAGPFDPKEGCFRPEQGFARPILEVHCSAGGAQPGAARKPGDSAEEPGRRPEHL
jgi:isoamylase